MLANPPDVSGEQFNREYTVEIVLDPDVLAALYRRGRRRFRDIQSSSQAALKLDRLRGVLRVTGTRDTIADVQRQLESVSGHHLTVSVPVWTELMRTRADPDLTQAAVARIQQQSGCRVHIERNSQQVQLFGPKDTSLLAQRLLVELESMCTECIVEMQDPLALDLQKLQVFAQEYGITLQVAQGHITIFGIKGAVAEAAKGLQRLELGEAQDDLGVEVKPSDVARSAITEAMSKLTVDGMDMANVVGIDPLGRNSSSSQAAGSLMQGAVTIKGQGNHGFKEQVPSHKQHVANMQDTYLQRQFEVCPTCGGGGNFCVNCGQPTGKLMPSSPLSGCPTCGIANFCANCGHATEKLNMESMGGRQQKVVDSAGYPYDSGMFHPDQFPMMAMQFVQPRPGNDGGQQVMMPVMCIPYSSSGQYSLPPYAGF